MIKNLPLIALITLGVAACGGDDVDDLDDEDVGVVTTDEALTDERMDDDMAMGDMDDDLDTMSTGTMGDDTMAGGMDDMQDGVTVTVNGVQQDGTVYVALQDESIFGSAEASYGTTMDPAMMTGDSAEVVIPDVAPGRYAIAVFQDTNGNGQLDLGTNGIPTEPWALSNSAGTTGAPSFDDASMEFDGMDDRADVTLNAMM